MARVKGLVVKIEAEKQCLILTPEGEFRRFPLPAGAVQVGMEIEVEARTVHGGSRRRSLALLVASLLLALLGWQMFFAFLPPAAAYVSLDINPSLELAVDARGRIVGVAALDPDGRELVRELRLKGQPLARGVELVVSAAVARGYLDTTGQGVVLAAVAPAGEKKEVPVTAGQVAAAIDTSLKTEGVAARIVVAPTPASFHRAAKKQGLSLGKYALGQAARVVGQELAPAELKKGIGEIEQSRRIKLETIFQGPGPMRDNPRPGAAGEEGPALGAGEPPAPAAGKAARPGETGNSLEKPAIHGNKPPRPGLLGKAEQLGDKLGNKREEKALSGGKQKDGEINEKKGQKEIGETGKGTGVIEGREEQAKEKRPGPDNLQPRKGDSRPDEEKAGQAGTNGPPDQQAQPERGAPALPDRELDIRPGLEQIREGDPGEPVIILPGLR